MRTRRGGLILTVFLQIFFTGLQRTCSVQFPWWLRPSCRHGWPAGCGSRSQAPQSVAVGQARWSVYSQPSWDPRQTAVCTPAYTLVTQHLITRHKIVFANGVCLTSFNCLASLFLECYYHSLCMYVCYVYSEQNRTEPNRTEPNRTEQNRTFVLVCYWIILNVNYLYHEYYANETCYFY